MSLFLKMPYVVRISRSRSQSIETGLRSGLGYAQKTILLMIELVNQNTHGVSMSKIIRYAMQTHSALLNSQEGLILKIAQIWLSG